MVKTKPRRLLIFLLIFTMFLGNVVAKGSRGRSLEQTLSHSSQVHLPSRKERMTWRRAMIGSTAPTCTYNECRGCRYRCRAEQVPVEGNDPINSAYHYRCICHR